MEDKAPYYATLSYSSSLAPELKELCQSLGLKQIEFLESAIKYFRRTGINPNDEQLDFKSQVARTENRLIGFIKTQDKEIKKNYLQVDQRFSTIENLLLQQIEIQKQINEFQLVVVNLLQSQ